MKSLKFSNYLEIRKPTYVFIKITSHKGIRNFNSTQIAKMIALSYKALNKKLYKEQKKFIIECNFKISYVIDIVENNANFYFIIPKIFKNNLLEKINEIWSKATVEEVENPFVDVKQDFVYEVRTTKEDALSLTHDRKSNDPLNYVLSVMDIMKSEDRLTMITNFMPRSQFGWLEEYAETMEKLKLNKNLEKATMTPSDIIKSALLLVVTLLDKVTEVLCDFVGSEKDDEQSLYSAILGVLEQQKEISSNTKNKKQALIIPTQIAVCSNKEELCNSSCQALKVLDEDNEITYRQIKAKNVEKIKKVKKKKEIKNPKNIEKKKERINILDFDFNISKNIFSSDEATNFLKIPGRALLLQHGIKHIKVEENLVPKQLQKGYFNLGESSYKGNKVTAYLEDDYNKGNLPMVLIGQQGSGKSEYIKNIAKNCIDNNECLVVLDFIKNCNLSEAIASVTPKEKLIKLNLANERYIQGIGYNEMKIEDGMSAFKKLSLASMQTQQIMNLVDSISVGDPLSSRMRRYLSSASKVVFALGYNSLKDVVNCLERHEYRSRFINNISMDLKVHLEDEINTLLELDEWSKGSKATKDKDEILPTVSGTNGGKIEHILDRVAMLREDFKLKYMYDKGCDKNINLVDCMQKGKIVLIQMKEDDFPTKMTKNILVTYWLSKVWLSSQIRGGKDEKPLRCNFIVDEIFQAPTSLEMLSYIIPQSRKFGLHTILSTQFIKQLDKVFESLEASGSSFMLLKGCNENDFNHLKSKFDGIFEYEDLRDMQQFNSMNLINYSGGYASFITKLPKPI